MEKGNKLFTCGEKGWNYLKEPTESFMPTLFKPIATSGEHVKTRNYYHHHIYIYIYMDIIYVISKI